MGCSSSSQRIIGFSSRAKKDLLSNPTPDPNPNPVYLCRDRTELIRIACDRRYDAAAAHVAYLRSLSDLGESLRQFASGELTTSSAPGSPVLTLPTSSKKGKSSKADTDPGSGTVTPLSHSLSFGDEEEERLKPISSTVTPLTHGISIEEEEKPSEQKPQPVASRKLEVEDSVLSPPIKSNSMASKTMPSPANTYQPYNYDYPYGYGYGFGYENGFGNGYGFGYDNGFGNGYGFGYEATNSSLNFEDRPGPSKPATPPMPVQESSGWEFFDPFPNYDQFVENYRYLNSNSISNSNSNSLRSSPDLNRVRKQEGIPDLEDEVKFEEKQMEIEREKQQEIEREREKQIEIERQKLEKGKEKVKDDGNDNGMDPSTSATMEKATENGKGKVKDDINDNGMNPCTSATMEKATSINTEEGSGGKNKDVQFEVETATKSSISIPDILVAVRVRDLNEVIDEISEQFHNVADCAKEVSDMLEVSKVPHRSGALGAISLRILDPTLPILPNSCLPHKHLDRGKTGKVSGNSTGDTANGDINGLTPLSLSLTLDKLYVWEKRLYKEVKDEEKLRAEYERKYQRLKYLDERGADHVIIKTANEAVTSLSNRISIVMKSADTISSRIHHIRDEELQPQLMQLVQSLIRMWKSIYDCHNKQLKAIKDLNTSNIKPRTENDLKTVARFTLRLEKEISRWHQHLKDWIGTQRSFIEALNGYLIRWIRNEPDPFEETLDGVPPFSPGRIGAPPSFVISNDWYQGVKNVSEKVILEYITNFKKLVRHYRKLQEDESRYRMNAEHLSMIYDRKLKSLQATEIRIGTENSEIVSSNGKEDLESTETIHVHGNDRLIEQLEAMKRKRDEEIKKKLEAQEKLNKIGSGVLKTGLVPVFEELVNFLSEYLKAYQAVRVPV